MIVIIRAITRCASFSSDIHHRGLLAISVTYLGDGDRSLTVGVLEHESHENEHENRESNHWPKVTGLSWTRHVRRITAVGGVHYLKGSRRKYRSP
jgi:hypothetical protein